MFKKLDEVEDRFREVEGLLSEPGAASDQNRFRGLSKEHSDLSVIVEAYRAYQQLTEDIEDNREMLRDSDSDIRDMAKAELSEMEPLLAAKEQELKLILLPRDPMDEKNIILEIRAGTGGDEAALFVGDLYRMYSRYADTMKWKVEMMSASESEAGGFKEVVAMISGDRVYSRLKYESGTHRVQRVPETETQGRIHTSACTVAVLPEAEDVDVDIDPGDLRVDIFRASGAGGQHVNKTESAIRITHIPTGLVVSCQDEKSQHKNKARAMKVLNSRLFDKMQADQNALMAADRKSQVGSGDRSERIRTYNYPQGRCTDHRIGLTLYKLDSIMTGSIEEIIESLTTHYQSEALARQEG